MHILAQSAPFISPIKYDLIKTKTPLLVPPCPLRSSMGPAGFECMTLPRPPHPLHSSMYFNNCNVAAHPVYAVGGAGEGRGEDYLYGGIA